jgi:DNA-binding GntR family transcriptional regulator
MTEARTTRADVVRQSLADDIITGRLAAGARLDEASLARRFGVSRTPVREALRELAATGLVRMQAHRGAVAATIGEERLQELFDALAEMEGICARLSAANMTSADRRSLEALHARCGELVRSGDAELYHAANAEFHVAIRSGCRNAVLQEMTADLRRRFAPLSLAQFRGPGRLAQSYAEHHVIVAAILRGEGERAYQATRTHLLSVRRSFISYAEAATTAQREALSPAGVSGCASNRVSPHRAGYSRG